MVSRGFLGQEYIEKAKNFIRKTVENKRKMIQERMREIGEEKPDASAYKLVFLTDGTYKSKRKAIIEYYGNKCMWCGYSEHPSILKIIYKSKKDKNLTFKKAVNDEYVILCPNCYALLRRGSITLTDILKGKPPKTPESYVIERYSSYLKPNPQANPNQESLVENG